MVLFGMFYGRNLSGDVWWHLKTGQWIVQNHALPFNDPFSYTARNPMPLHEWGAEIIEWLAYSISPTALAFMSVMLISGAFLIAFAEAFRRSRSLIAAFIVISIGASASAASAEMRPQVFSFVLVAVIMLLLQRYHERGGRSIWLIAPIMMLWINLHAIFLIGFVLIFIEAVAGIISPPEWAINGSSPRLRAAVPLVLIAIVSAALTLINPNGITPYVYPLHVLRQADAMKYTSEWNPVNLHELTGQSFAVLIALAVLGLTFMRRRPAVRDCICVAVFAIAAMRSQRNETLFALVAAGPITLWLTYSLNRLREKLSKWMLDKAANKTAWAILGILAIILFIWRVSNAQGKTPFDYMNTSEVFPAAACDYIELSNISGPMYNDYNYGGYLIWRLWPKHKVFVDSRMEPFFNGAFEESNIATNELVQGYWKKVFAKHKINFAVLSPEDPLAGTLQKQPDWVCVFPDTIFPDTKGVVFVHKTPENKAIIDESGSR
jgi:hypothetical protein